MQAGGREEMAVRRLVRTAQVRIKELETHYANLCSAKASAETSLEWLRQAVGTERESRRSEARETLAGFLEGASEKERALVSTRDTLGAEIAAVRETLDEARRELDKLQRLLEGRAVAAPLGAVGATPIAGNAG